MTTQSPGSGAAEEPKPRKPKIKPANWHPTGIGEVGDGPGPVVPQPGDELSGAEVPPTAPPTPDGQGGVITQPGTENWHPTSEPDKQ